MKLKKLVLQGYKTFASKTEFIFDDGITAVVGPNGSGKSNVADAIRWVLGEQSFRTLRGKRTVDMIFAGSKTRARAGMAQAVLTLDNSDGWLPIDYTEVEICRRAYRSGENEYLLNGQKVRLMDVNELLARAGIAEQTYTIIGQGLIDQALSLKADERRALFEEAAGISHYKARRATTLRKLQDTQRNLERVYDILSELKPRLNSLRRQAQRAENYGRVEEDLRQMLRIWYGYQWQKARYDLRQRRTAATQAEQGWESGRRELLLLQEQIDQKREKLHDIESQLQELQQKRETVRETWEKARRQVAIMSERRSALERQLAESASDLPDLEQQHAAAENELQAALAELQTAQATFDTHQLELKAFETGFLQKQQLINATQKEINNFERKLRQLQTEIAQSQGQVSQLKERAAAAEQPDNDQPALTDLTAEIEKLDKVMASARENEESINLVRRELSQKRRDLEATLKENRRQLDQNRRALNQTQTAVTRLQTRVEMLDAQRQSTAPVAKNLIIGRLVELITIPDDHRTHLEHALLTAAETLIVKDAAALHSLVDSRSADVALRAIARDGARPVDVTLTDGLLHHEGVIGRASDVCRCDEADRPVVEALLGGILLVDHDQTALKIAAELPPGIVAVAPSGLSSHVSGLIAIPRQDGQGSPLAAEQAWREAQDNLTAVQKDLQNKEKAVEKSHQAVRDLQKQLDETNRERQRQGRLADEAQQRSRRAQRDLDRVVQRREFITQQRQKQEKERVQLQERITRIEAAVSQKDGELLEVESGLDEKRRELAALPIGEAQQQRQMLSQQISGARSIVDGRRAIVDTRQTAMRQSEGQIQRLKNRRQEWSNQLLKMDIAADEKELAALETELNDILSAIEPLQKSLLTIQRELRLREGEAAVSQKAAHELETSYTQTKVALTQLETHIDNLQDRIRAELGIVDLSYDDDVRGDTPLPLTGVVDKLPHVFELPDELEESIQKQRAQLSRMGAINPDAPAEYKEVQERFEFMNQQIDDLEETEKQLRAVIEELDELTSRAFADTVEKVNVVFGEMFTRMFGGGSGHLVLTDPDDLTITGVDIVAQLPGRRPQGLALLSGGERSLTAASLIFALLKVSPTPFCAMDEVDAALDEANVNRFRDVLKELSAKTQFIVITHNRGTVQAAQAIYGITMGTDSTSQVISLKPDEYVTQKELLTAEP
ncbi:MAG: chromosome segregation protein SMC [Ardenticatenaceae bacterium]|nr:chromosome segregation protein SMC [Ardenticatenaceae bacterium]